MTQLPLAADGDGRAWAAGHTQHAGLLLYMIVQQQEACCCVALARRRPLCQRLTCWLRLARLAAFWAEAARGLQWWIQCKELQDGASNALYPLAGGSWH
jgi:hypothetical protein